MSTAHIVRMFAPGSETAHRVWRMGSPEAARQRIVEIKTSTYYRERFQGYTVTLSGDKDGIVEQFTVEPPAQS